MFTALHLAAHAGFCPQVAVLDNGEPPLRSTSRVVVCVLDVNDNPPVFSHKLFNVRLPERLSPVTPGPVYRLVASDMDTGLNGRVTYSIEESDKEGFSIDPVTGVVSSSSTFTAGEYNILTVRGGWRPRKGVFLEDTGERDRETATRHDGGGTARQTGSPNFSQRIRILGLFL